MNEFGRYIIPATLSVVSYLKMKKDDRNWDDKRRRMPDFVKIEV